MGDRRKIIKNSAIVFTIVVFIFSLFSTIVQKWFEPSEVTYGATFSKIYANDLNLDWQEVYLASLDDLKIEKFRIPIYWSDIEKSEGVRDFSSLDWMMEEAAKRGVDVTLVIGAKVPRWPECYIPDWVETASMYKIKDSLADFMKETVIRYKDHPALERWQVENEAFFPFGVCDTQDPKRVFDEIEIVRYLDPDHPIQMTASGEQSFWVFTARPADILGFSLYKWAWNPVFGYTPLTVPELFYALQNKVASLYADKVIISELQAEPWMPPIFDRNDKSQLGKFYQLFTAQDLYFNVEIAKRTGVDEVYLWGVEWWYYLKVNGNDQLWEAAKDIINEN